MVDGISHVYLHEICRSFMSTSKQAPIALTALFNSSNHEP